jgi:hypothetical protein
MSQFVYTESMQPKQKDEDATVACPSLALKRKKGEGGHDIFERKGAEQETRGGRRPASENGRRRRVGLV